MEMLFLCEAPETPAPQRHLRRPSFFEKGLCNWSRVQSPESRAKSREPRVQSPESRAKSPEPRVQSPEPRVQSPEPRVQSPESRAKSQTKFADSAQHSSPLTASPPPARRRCGRCRWRLRLRSRRRLRLRGNRSCRWCGRLRLRVGRSAGSDANGSGPDRRVR
jgi:hypothetical protein